MTITFRLVPFIPIGILRERSGFNHFPYSIFKGDYILYEVLWLPVDHQLLRYQPGLLFSDLGKQTLHFSGPYIVEFGVQKCIKSLSSVT